VFLKTAGKNKKLIAGALIGNVMEFYDYVIYAYLSIYLAKNFFPVNNEFISFLITLVVFSTGYLMRPFGGLFFGHIGDRYGRRKSLLLSVFMTTISTFLIGALPVYDDVGIFASILLLLLRLIQGFSVSGEQGGAAIYLSEIFGKGRHGFIGSIILGSSYFGVFLGALSCFLMTILLTDQEIFRYGWRIPFLASVFLGVASILFRYFSQDSYDFLMAKQQKKVINNPIKNLFSKESMSLLNSFFLVSGLAVPVYTYTIYFPIHLVRNLGFSQRDSLLFSFVSLLIISGFVPLIGYYSAKRKSKKNYFWGSLMIFMFGYWIFNLLQSNNITFLCIGMAILLIPTSMMASEIFAILIENFEVQVRYTGVSLTFNSAMAIFGGTVPALYLMLENRFGYIANGVYLSIFGLMGMVFFVINNRFFKKRMFFKYGKS
jgi:MHS family proline/betaine transporter-like MFS transporter